MMSLLTELWKFLNFISTKISRLTALDYIQKFGFKIKTARTFVRAVS